MGSVGRCPVVKHENRDQYIFFEPTTTHLLTFFKNSDFTEFCAVGTKRLLPLGVGLKQTEPLTKEEEVLWQKRLFGHHRPQALVDTMVHVYKFHTKQWL